MRGWSISQRLTAWYCGVLVAGLAMFGAGTWLAVRHSLLSELDKTLHQNVDAVSVVLQTESAENATALQLREELAEYARTVPEGIALQVRDQQGAELLSYRPRGGNSRVLRQAVKVPGREYDILAAGSLQGVDAVLRRFSLLMLAAIPIVLMIAGAGGYWVSRRALSPVDEITAAARTITIRNLSQRLAVPPTGDEMQRLSETWNDTLARLDGAVKRLSQFTADASHELRTPIALIRTTAELALRRERSPEAYRDALQQIHDESERTSRLIDDLLTLARADAGLNALQLQPVELTRLVREVCQDCEALAAERKLHLEQHATREHIIIQGNEPGLRRLLLVLIDNALKYTPAGGLITVSVDGNGSGASLQVRDNGIGIADGALPKIFDRFFREDESRHYNGAGAGLGLSIAKWIAERHHAQIAAESTQGKGSVFSVHFPA